MMVKARILAGLEVLQGVPLPAPSLELSFVCLKGSFQATGLTF